MQKVGRLEDADFELQSTTKYIRELQAKESFCWATKSFPITKSTKLAIDRFTKKEKTTIFELTACLVHLLVSRLSGQENVRIGCRTEDVRRYHLGSDHNNLFSGPICGVETSIRERERFKNSIKRLEFGNFAKKYEIGINVLDLNDGTNADLLSPNLTPSFLNFLVGCSSSLEFQPRLHLVYRDDVFTPKRVQVIGEQLVQLFNQIGKNKSLKTQDVSLVAKEHLPILPNPKLRMKNKEYRDLNQMLSGSFAKYSTEPAISWRGKVWTYKDLDLISKNLAMELEKSGAASSRVVAVMGDKSFGLIAAMVAVIKSGSVLLTLDPKLPEVRKLAMLKIAKAGLLVNLVNDTTISQSAGIPTLLVNPENGSVLDRIAKRRKWQHLSKGGSDAAYIFFTSGTTGEPKAILGSHRGLAHFLNWQKSTFRVGPGDKHAQLIGISFDVVLRDIFLPLVSGACSCLPEHLSGEPLLQWMLDESISVIHTVPTLAETWLLFVKKELTLRNLKFVFFAGEPLKDTLIAKWRESISNDCLIANFYGPTETTLAKFCYIVPDLPRVGIQPVGFPQPFTQGLILNKNGRLCGIGEQGEIVIRTRYMSHGYLNGSRSGSKFIQNPLSRINGDRCYRTGDLGSYLPDGAIALSGRRDHQIKISGQRVELGEIEVTFLKSTNVDQAQVIAIGESGTYKLVAFVVPRKGKKLNDRSLQDFLAKTLPGHMVPAHIYEVTSFPLTVNGKVDRSRLSKIYEENESKAGETQTTISFENELQEKVFQIWRKVLGSYTFSLNDNFFRVGGSSFLALTLTALISKTLNVDVRPADVLVAPTFRDLVTAIGQKIQSRQFHLAEVQIPKRQNTGPLSYGQSSDWILENEVQSAQRGTSKYIEFSGRLDIGALDRAFIALLERYPTLRTVFQLTNGHPTQFIKDTPSSILQIFDFSDLSTAEAKSKISESVFKIYHDRFNLVDPGGLVKIIVYLVPGERGVILLRSPHILLDGVSLNIVLKDLGHFYSEMKSDSHGILGPKPEAQLPVTIVQLAHLERRLESAAEYRDRKSYWDAYVGRVKSILSVDRRERDDQLGEIVNASFELAESEVDRVADACEHLSCTRFDLVLALFARQISRFSGQSSSLLKVRHSGRLSHFDAELVGNLTVMVPVMVDCSGSLEGALAGIRQELNAVTEHMPFPLHEVWSELNGLGPDIEVNYLQPNSKLEFNLEGLEIRRCVPLDGFLGAKRCPKGIFLSFNDRKVTLIGNKNFVSQTDIEKIILLIKEELSALVARSAGGLAA